MADCARPAPFTMSGRRSKCHRDSGCTGTKRAAHIGTYALAVRVDEGAHIAGYALPVIRVLSPWREQNAGSRAPWRTPRGLLSRRSVRLFGCRGATDRPGGGRVRFPMTRTVASDHVCCRRWAVRAHARCPAPRRVPSRHFQVSRSLMSNPGEEVGTNPSHASSTCGSMLRSSR
jgi:hypothetical protein